MPKFCSQIYEVDENFRYEKEFFYVIDTTDMSLWHCSDTVWDSQQAISTFRQSIHW